jgi:hypothetical protein
MCWHDQKEEQRYRREMAERAERAGKLPTTTTVSVVDADGKYVGAMPVEWRSAQKVANTIRDLRAWHPNAVMADLTEVNKLRAKFTEVHPTKTLPRLWFETLPAPTGEAEPYAFAKPTATWSEELMEAGQYLHAQNAKLSRKGVLARVFG